MRSGTGAPGRDFFAFFGTARIQQWLMVTVEYIRRWWVVHRVSSPWGPVDPSFRALPGRLKFTIQRHKFNKYPSSYWGAASMWYIWSAYNLIKSNGLFLRTLLFSQPCAGPSHPSHAGPTHNHQPWRQDQIDGFQMSDLLWQPGEFAWIAEVDSEAWYKNQLWTGEMGFGLVVRVGGSSRFESLILSHHSRTKLHVSVINEVQAERGWRNIGGS